MHVCECGLEYYFFQHYFQFHILCVCVWTHGKKCPNGLRASNRHKEPFHCDSTVFYVFANMYATSYDSEPTIIITFHSAYTTFARCEFFSSFFSLSSFIFAIFIDMCETFHWVLELIYSRFKFYGSKMIRWRNFLLSSFAVLHSDRFRMSENILVIDFFEVFSRERERKKNKTENNHKKEAKLL